MILPFVSPNHFASAGRFYGQLHRSKEEWHRTYKEPPEKLISSVLCR
jgi:hypothetical protein